MADRVVISCVERGWQAARVWSLEAARECRVVHVIKGRLPADVAALIAPRKGIELVSVPRAVFWPCVLACAAWAWIGRRLDGIVVDHDRSAARLSGWARLAGVRLLRITQEQGSPRIEPEPCGSR